MTVGRPVHLDPKLPHAGVPRIPHGGHRVLLVRPPHRPGRDRARRHERGEREQEGRTDQHHASPTRGDGHDGFAMTTNLFSARLANLKNPRSPPKPSIRPKIGISKITAQGSHHLRRPPPDTPAFSRRPSQYIQITYAMFSDQIGTTTSVTGDVPTCPRRNPMSSTIPTF